jgi:outer membrane protein
MKIRSTLILGILLIASSAFAQQSMKIGYTNVDYILSLMPETKQVEAEYNAYQIQIENQLQAKIKDFQTKGQKFQQEAASMTDVIRADKQSELQSLQASIETFQRNAQTSLSKKQGDLFQPLFDKIGIAINAIAEENNYSHVLSSGAPGMDILLFAKEEFDVSNLILKKLGITPPPAGK